MPAKARIPSGEIFKGALQLEATFFSRTLLYQILPSRPVTFDHVSKWKHCVNLGYTKQSLF